MLVQIVDERRQYFSISITLKFILMCCKHCLERLIVLDNAIMYNVDLPHLMWVGIAFARCPVGCPASVTNANRISRLVASCKLIQRSHLAFCSE